MVDDDDDNDNDDAQNQPLSVRDLVVALSQYSAPASGRLTNLLVCRLKLSSEELFSLGNLLHQIEKFLLAPPLQNDLLLSEGHGFSTVYGFICLGIPDITWNVLSLLHTRSIDNGGLQVDAPRTIVSEKETDDTLTGRYRIDPDSSTVLEDIGGGDTISNEAILLADAPLSFSTLCSSDLIMAGLPGSFPNTEGCSCETAAIISALTAVRQGSPPAPNHQDFRGMSRRGGGLCRSPSPSWTSPGRWSKTLNRDQYNL